MAGQALPSANAYTVSSSVLLIKVSYLAGLNLSKGDTAKFDVTFDTGAVVTLTVNVANSYTPSGSSSGSSDSSTIIKMATADGVTTEFAKFTGSTGTDKTATASVTERQIADAITAATESKGFDVNCKKTRLFQIEKTGHEKTVNIIAIAITVIIVGWRVALWIL